MFRWPETFPRIPDDAWTTQALGQLALKYDTVENHGWYENLDPTVEALTQDLRDDQVLVDYSGGTGILADRLLRRAGGRPIGIVIVDASPKFLRLALEKLRHDGRVAYRHIRYRKEDRRLQLLDEVLEPPYRDRGVDALASTNAIHLYYDLDDTLRSWARVLKSGARAFIQSGNIGNSDARPGEWIIDETVEAIHRSAIGIVRSERRFEAFRAVLDDAARLDEHAAFRRKMFLPVRPLSAYVGALEGAGFRVLETRARTIEARVDDWYEFLATYHEGVLGWAGGSERIEGAAPGEDVVRERLELLREAMGLVFDSRQTFPCCWTYVTAEAP